MPKPPQLTLFNNKEHRNKLPTAVLTKISQGVRRDTAKKLPVSTTPFLWSQPKAYNLKWKLEISSTSNSRSQELAPCTLRDSQVQFEMNQSRVFKQNTT